MKKILPVVLLMLVPVCFCFSQSISVYNLNASQFPRLTAKMFILDAFGNVASNISESDIVIDEDGIIRPVTSLDCPVPVPPEALSAVLTIDVSGSMYGSGIEMAQAAARAWVEAIPLGKSECALTTFDSQNYLNCDFTQDRTKLLEAIAKLAPNGGTDFNAGLLNKMFGSLVMAEHGKYKRTVVFLTDGYASGDENAIVKKAEELDAVIYCVILGASAPEILKHVAERTGGEYFEGVTTVTQATDVYRQILSRAQGGEPCTLTWESDGCPDNRRVTFAVPTLGLSTEQHYSVNLETLPQLAVLPGNSLRFGEVQPGNYLRKNVRLVAGNNNIAIDSITNTNDRFSIIDFPDGGVLLQKDDILNLTVEFLPFDSAYQFTRFSIHTNACHGNYFYASGGYAGVGGSTIKIIEPNGGEMYAANSDTVITWSGIPESDTVKIEFSSDGGFNWKAITREGTGLKHDWTLPENESDKCLIRIKQLESSGATQLHFRAHSYYVKSVSVSADSKYVATCGEDRSFKVFSTETGENVYNESSYLIYRRAAFSPDGSKIAVAMSDYSVQLYSTSNWKAIDTLRVSSSWTDYLAFSADGNRLALQTGDNEGKNLYVVNLLNDSVSTTAIQEGKINRTVPSGDAEKLITSSQNGAITVYDFSSLNEIKTITSATANNFDAITMSPDGSRIAASANSGKRFFVLDVNSGQTVVDTAYSAGTLTDVAWSYDGQYIVTSDDKGNIALFSGETYDSVNSFAESSFAVNDIEWSRDSRFLVAGTNDNYVRIWNFEMIVQEAVSENYFSIVKPELAVSDINFGRLKVASIKDSVFKNVLINSGRIPQNVEGYRFSGNSDTSAFCVVSHFPPLEVAAAGSEYIELRFSPTEAKSYSAVLEVLSGADTLQINVSGTGFVSPILDVSSIVDFGEEEVDVPRDTIINLFYNKSGESILIDSVVCRGPDYEQFSIFESQEKITVASGDTYKIPVRFLPVRRGLTNSVWEIHFAIDGSPAILQLAGCGVSDCGEQSFNISDFSNAVDVNLVGGAYESEGTAILNQAMQYTSGGVVSHGYFPADSGFVATFSFTITSPYQYVDNENSYIGADGMSFVIHNMTNKTIGGGGGGLGYMGMKKAVAVELDLFANDKKQIENYNDPNGNHLAVMIIPSGDSVLSPVHNLNNVIGLNTGIDEIRSDGTLYYEKVEYDYSARELNVYIDTTGEFKEPSLTVSDFDLGKYVNLENNKGAFVSVYASSGSSFQSHRLRSFKICSYKTATAVISGVKEKASDNLKAFISPNPVNDESVLVIESIKPENCVIEYFDISGKKLSEETRSIFGRESIALPENIRYGSFFARISADKKSLTIKAIKQ